MISLVTGWLVCGRLLPGGPLVSRAALALALGLGLLSLTTYLWLVAALPGIPALLGLEGGVLVAALLLPRAGAPPPLSSGPRPRPTLLVATTALAGVGALLAAIHMLQRFPWGAWDAVDIWNYRALVFHRAGLGPAFDGVNHPDYPLLVPLVTAYGWRFVGEAGLLPFLVGTSCAAATAGLLYGEISWRRGSEAAMIATALLLATPFYAVQAATQRADVPLSFYALAASAVLVRHERCPEPGLLLLAGLLLGCAAWTKNEGLAFATALVIAWLATAPRARLRRLGWLAAGVLPFALALLRHKLTCGATTDLIEGQGVATLSRLGDPTRWALVAGSFARGSAFFAASAVALSLALRWLPGVPCGQAEEADLRFVWLALALMLAIDFAVYLTTPLDPAWHLESSLDRVLLQLWPTLLLAVAIGAPPPWRGAEAKPAA